MHQTLLVEELQKHGAEVAFLDRPMSRDPHDQLLLQIRGAVAEHERTLIAERMRRGRLRKLRAGTLLPWTRPPYGYRLDPDRPRDPAGVRLDEAEAAVVRDLFVWFADERQSIYALRQNLDQLGVASPRGHRPWSTSALHSVLTNPTYVGQVFANRVRTRPAERRRSALLPVGHSGMGATQAVDAAEWIAVGPVPAIISQAQFDRTQERLAYNRQMARRNNRVHPYLLRGLVSCGQCRLACCGRCTRAGYAYYVCPTRLRSRLLVPGERCSARYIPARALDDLVWRDLCEVLAAPEMIAHAMQRARGGHWLPQELQARRANLRRGRAALSQQIERLTDAYLAGVVPMAEYQRRRRDTEARLQALDRQEAELTHDAERQGETAGLAAHAEVFCRRVRDGLAAADFDQKRALLELLVDRVVVANGAVEIRYVVPTGPDGEREPFCRLRSDYRNGHVQVQSYHRSRPSCPDSARPENRGSGRLLGAEPDDQARHASVAAHRLNAFPVTAVRPQSELRTKAHRHALHGLLLPFAHHCLVDAVLGRQLRRCQRAPQRVQRHTRLELRRIPLPLARHRVRPSRKPDRA